MRLIDADKIEADGYALHRIYQKDAHTMISETIGIDTIPTIDAVPVVRCKYCVHRGVDYYGRITCRRICISRNECGIQLPSENFYCAAGEVGLVFRKGKWVWSNTKEGMFHAVN